MTRTRVFDYRGVEYHQVGVNTHALQRELIRLSEVNELRPLTFPKLNDYLSYGMLDSYGYLLYILEPEVRKGSQYGRCWTFGTSLGSGLPPVNHQISYDNVRKQQFQAGILFQFTENDGPIGTESPVIVCNAILRDPWADAAAIAFWLDLTLLDASRDFGEVLEIRLTVPETNTQLQKELRGLGYFMSRYFPDSPEPMLARQFNAYRRLGELEFTKLLRVRDRLNQGKHIISPKKLTLRSDDTPF